MDIQIGDVLHMKKENPWLFESQMPPRFAPFTGADTAPAQKTMTLAQVTPYKQSADRAVRIAALEAEGKAVLFTGDLKNPQVDFPAAAKEKPLDLLICECAHFPATDYIPALEGCDIKKICMNHYSPRFSPTVPGLTETLTMPFLLATDGLELTV